MTNTQTIKVSGTLNTPFSALNDYVVYSGGSIIDPFNSFSYTNPCLADTWVSSVPDGTGWGSVTYGNDLFVALSVGSPGGKKIMTSQDGINWRARRTPFDNLVWNHIFYGGGLFIVISHASNDPRMFTSSNGIIWTARTIPVGSWSSITYNGIYVGVAIGGTTHRVMTSVDGIVWTPRLAAALNSWTSITYGNGLFVAVASSGLNRVMISPDGIDWTARNVPIGDWTSVTYGNGLFVAVAQSGTNRVMTSPDGINWTARTATEEILWRSVTYGNGLFVAVASDGTNQVMTSPDGIDWTPQIAAEETTWQSITYGKGTFVAIGGSNKVMISTCPKEDISYSFYYTSSATSININDITSYSGKTKPVFNKEINPQSLHFEKTGVLMFVLGNTSDRVHSYYLSTPWDVNTANYVDYFNVESSLENSPTAMFFKPDGNKMYILGDEYNDILQFNLGLSWNINTAEYVANFPVVFENASKGLFISPDGLNLYVTGISSKKIHQYGLTNPWEISTGTYPLKEFSVENEESQPSDIFFKSDGSRLFVTGLEKGRIFEYELSTPWDVTTAVYSNNSFSLSSEDDKPVGLFFKNDGRIFYTLGTETDSVYQYNIGSSQTWTISSTSFITLSGGSIRKNYNDLRNLKQFNIGNLIFCDSEVIFNFSNFDQTKSKIIKLIFDPKNGESVQTFSTQLSNSVVIYPKLDSIKSNYYPTELYNTFYYPNFEIFYEDGNYINLTIPLTVFQCGIYETYKEKRILDTLPYYANTDNVVLFINDDVNNELFIGDINTRLPFILSANVPAKDVNLPFLLELVPQQSTIESIDPFIPQPPINENPIIINTGDYTYAAQRGLNINPNYSQFFISEVFGRPANSGLSVSDGGAPYFAGSGISIELIQLD